MHNSELRLHLNYAFNNPRLFTHGVHISFVVIIFIIPIYQYVFNTLARERIYINIFIQNGVFIHLYECKKVELPNGVIHINELHVYICVYPLLAFVWDHSTISSN